MHQDEKRVEESLTRMVERLSSRDPSSLSKEEGLALRLNEQFPKDIGVFAVFLLNYIILQPGESIYLGANEPHAYISGLLGG